MPMGYPQPGPMTPPGQMGYPAQMAGQIGHPQMALHPGQLNQMAHPGHVSGPNMLPSYSYGGQAMKAAAPPRSNALVVVLIAVLIAAIGVLAYLVVTK